MNVQRFFTLVLSLSLGVLLPEIVAAKPHGEMSAEMDAKSEAVEIIPQPFTVKATVTVGGLALIGLELWWFLFSQPHKKD